MNLTVVGAHFYSVRSKLAWETLLHKTWKWVNKSHICQGDCNNCQSHMHFQAESVGFRHRQSELSICSATENSRTRTRAASPASQPASQPQKPTNNFVIHKKTKNKWRKPLTKTTEVLSQKVTREKGSWQKGRKNNTIFTHSSFQKPCTQQSTFDLKPNCTTIWERRCKITYVS